MYSDEIKVLISCQACGGTLETVDDKITDDSIVKRKSCGQEIGTYADLSAKMREVAENRLRELSQPIFDDIKRLFKSR